MMRLTALFYQNPAGFLATVLLFVFSVIGFTIDSKSAYIFLVAFVVVGVSNILFSLLSMKSTVKYVKQLNKSLAGEDINSVENFPLPCVLCDMKGNVVWYNDGFGQQIIPDISKHSFNMSSFFDGFRYSEFASQKIVNTQYGDKKYTVFVTKVKSESNPMLCMYFFEDTYLKVTSSAYEISRPFVMYINVDNIEQLSRQYSDSKFALVSSGIEGIIEEWLKDEAVIYKKLSSGRFIVICEKQHIDKFSADKFSVLNKVREYEFNNSPVYATLSVGVGGGDNFAQCEKNAKKSLDMSLGRGGDQVAIRNNDEFIYYGGLSNNNSDNTKVSPRQTSVNMSVLLKKYKKVLVQGHKFSDYDSVGASVGMCWFAQSLGLEAYAVVDENTTLSMPLVELVRGKKNDCFISKNEAMSICDDNTVVIVVDTHRQLLLDSPELYNKAKCRIIIDHHRKSADFISDSDVFYHLPSASSACEMVSELIQYSDSEEKMSGAVATALMSGIVLDTKDFVLRASQRTFEAAAFLRENNADTVKVRKLFAVDEEMLLLKNEIISSCGIYRDCAIAFTESDSSSVRIVTSKAADEMLNLNGVKASFVIYRINPTLVQVSARSFGEENVQLIVEKLGGGGHSTMAATQIMCDDISHVKAMLCTAIDEYYLNK